MARKNRYMPQNQPNRPIPSNQPPQNFEITTELAQAFLANRQAEIIIDEKRIALQDKQLALNADYAKESLKLQAEDLKRRPSESRKTFILIAGVAAFFSLVLIAFIIYLLESKHDDLVLKILGGVGWLGTNALAYYVGQRKSGKSKPSNSDTPSAEVIEE